MPLPANGVLSLQGHSRPGDTVHSKPKQAMLVRMSAETLEALEAFSSQPQMDFEFGDNPGIHIGDTFFPIRSTKEGTPHELYLRTSLAAKPNAPLKLYAHVTGKFTVERELQKVQDKVRETTKGAVKQRLERSTILLEAPPDLPSASSKKRKEPTSSMFRKPVRQSDQSKNNAPASSSTLPARVTSPTPTSSQRTTREGSKPARNRLIHLLAGNERNSDDIVRLVGGSNCSLPARRELLEIIDEVAEQSSAAKQSDKSSKLWRLKPESWKEVRPYQWPQLTETDRTSMARAARLAFKNLGIPETDPAWEHIRYRTQSTAATSSAGSLKGAAASKVDVGKADAPKRGVSSKEAKEKKANTKANPKAEIMMKDESIKVSPRASQVTSKTKERDGLDVRPTPTTSVVRAIPPVRKPPGSGFRMGKSASQDTRSDTVESPGRSPLHRPKPVDVRVKDREAPAASLPAKPAPSIPPPTAGQERKVALAISSQRTSKVKDRDASGGDSDKERRRDRESTRGMDRERVRSREGHGAVAREREQQESGETSSLKRKKLVRDIDESDEPSRSIPQKRRRTDEGGAPVTYHPKESRSGDLSLPKKPDLAQPPRVKPSRREPSPLPLVPKHKKGQEPSSRQPPPPVKLSSSSSSSSQAPNNSNANSSRPSKVGNAPAKPARRRSPIYTSSEDEGETRRPSRREAPSATLTTPPTAHLHPQSHLRRPLPTDHAALRARYNTSYMEYLTTLQKLMAQKSKLDTLLKNSSGSVGSITDEDEDIELMDQEELARLSLDHKKLHEELETIQQIFSKSGGPAED